MPHSLLFSPIKIGPVTLTNRIFMAPLTRLRSKEPGDIPTDLMLEYYRQRASAGLIISEATQISSAAKGSAGAPGLHSEAQCVAWKKIVAAVHAQHGHIAVQLWHTGRIGHHVLHRDGKTPVSPSALNTDIKTSLKDEQGKVYRSEVSEAKILTRTEIKQIVKDFGEAAANAAACGFDFLEIHGAHGYLIHEFLSPETNHRTDEYGGSNENRARFLFEIIEAMAKAWDISRIGLRLSPLGNFQGTDNGACQEANARWLIQALSHYPLAYLHLSEPDWIGGEKYTHAFRTQLRADWPGIIIGAGGYDKSKAEILLKEKLIDAIAFGRDYIANPDLVARLQDDKPLNPQRPEFFYGGGSEGYTDYPSLPSD